MASIFTDSPTQVVGTITLRGHWVSAKTCSICGPDTVLVARFTWGYGSPTTSTATQEYNTEDGSHSLGVTVDKDRTIAYWFSGEEYRGDCSCLLGSFVNGAQVNTKSYADDPTFNAPTNGTPTQKGCGNIAVTFNPKTTESSGIISLQYKLNTATDWIDGPTVASGQTGNSNRAVSSFLTNLTPGTTYNYRFKLVRDTANSGLAFSASGTFTTRAAQTITTDPASAIGNTLATLNGTVNPQSASNAVTYYFEWGLTTTYGNVTATQGPSSGTSGIPFTAALIGLVNTTTYHFRAVAKTGEVTVLGADRTFTTGAGAPTVTKVITETLTMSESVTSTFIDLHPPEYFNNRIQTTIYFSDSTRTPIDEDSASDHI